MIEFKKEEGRSFFYEAQDLFKLHYKEIAERQDVIKFNPNTEKYASMHEQDMIEVHSVRDDGKLVGYSVWFVFSHLHYKDSITASSDVLYIHPDYRKGFTGIQFLRWTTEEIKKRNPMRILFHVKPFLDYGPILERMGAKYFEKTYSIIME